ncbi:MAG: DUF4105 domain-containing protein [Prevotella sp.]|nr:DUF4105 domain-containing protein [Prevotella sp.]
MKRFKYIFISSLVVFLLSLTSNVKAQQYSNSNKNDSIQISLLTCGPGEEVYSLYGHTAIRFHDLKNNQDLVINYGMFSFSQRFFIIRFVFGLTDYEMGIMPFDAFMEEYESEGRWVKEQVINIPLQDKMKIAMAIENNYLPENKTYRYNYFYDNCTTRARDILIKNISENVEVKDNQSVKSSYRKEIHKWNTNHCWARWGNDLLLGVNADRSIDRKEQQFLPDNLSKDWKTATIKYTDGKVYPFISQEHYLIGKTLSTKDSAQNSNIFNPYTLIGAIILVILLASWKKTSHPLPYKIVMFCVWLTTGLCGIIITAMIFSQHPTVSLNFQILLLNPLNLGMLIPALARNKKYNLIILTCLILFMLGGIIQSYAVGLEYLAFILLIVSQRDLISQLLKSKKQK